LRNSLYLTPEKYFWAMKKTHKSGDSLSLISIFAAFYDINSDTLKRNDYFINENMLFLVQSAAVYGIDALIVDIEVNLQPVKGEADTSSPVLIVGLPDTAIRESRERIRAAITNSSFFFPFHKTTINLAPADVRKEGASFDLPIALGILGANGDLGNVESLENTLSIGELSLDGRVRPVRGVLSIALRARENGIKNLLVPEENASEAAVVAGVDVYPIRDLRQAVGVALELQTGEQKNFQPLKLNIADIKNAETKYRADFAEVRGQASAKRALEIAAAGGHNILMFRTLHLPLVSS
jgi:magnesium chelatase family protein